MNPGGTLIEPRESIQCSRPANGTAPWLWIESSDMMMTRGSTSSALITEGRPCINAVALESDMDQGSIGKWGTRGNAHRGRTG